MKKDIIDLTDSMFYPTAHEYLIKHDFSDEAKRDVAAALYLAIQRLHQ